MARFQQGRLEPGRAQPGMQPLRQGPSLQPDPRHRQTKLTEEVNQRLRLARHLGFPDNLPARVHHAHAAVFQLHVDPGVVLHGCSLLMLGAEILGPRFIHHHSQGTAHSARQLPAEAHYGI